MRTIGLDIGTTTLCGILCDSDSGAIIKTVTKSNDTFIPSVHPWVKQQDPSAIMEKLTSIVDTLLKEGNVSAIGVTGQMHGIVYLNAEGQPVGPLTTWQDGRGDQIFEGGKTYAVRLSELTGHTLSTGYGAVTHYYNTVNGMIPSDAVTFCTIQALAVMALTHSKKPLLHPSDAASIGLYDLKNSCFDRDAIARSGMDPAFFPEVAMDNALCGVTPSGATVSVAIGDNQASVLGSVSDPDRSILVNVGTGSQISCIVSEMPKDCDLDCRPFTDGRWLLVGSSLCGGRAYAILEKFFREIAQTVTEQCVSSAYPAMDRLMANFESPSEPLAVDTAFSGTRKQPDRRGRIENISVDNLTMANLCDGVMNGMVTELLNMYRQMLPHILQPPQQIIASGNGIRFNKPLAKRFSASFGLPLSIPAHREEAAFGAALFAIASHGKMSAIETAKTRIVYLTST